MTKEELINLINSLTVEEITGLSISYYSEKEPSSYGYNNKERKLKVISFGNDINRKLEMIRSDMNNICERTNQYCINTVEEILNSKGVNYGGK